MANSTVKTHATIVIGGKLALGVQSNLVEHPSEENKAANLPGRMSEIGNFHGAQCGVTAQYSHRRQKTDNLFCFGTIFQGTYREPKRK